MLMNILKKMKCNQNVDKQIEKNKNMNYNVDNKSLKTIKSN